MTLISPDPPLQSSPHRRRRRCACCGQPFATKTRPGRFCSDRCRDAARRQRNHRRFGVTGHRGSSRPRIFKNKPVSSKPYKADFCDRGSGIYGPTAVVEVEIRAGRSWHPVVSLAGIVCQVTRLPKSTPASEATWRSDWSPNWLPSWPVGPDLTIPEFLQRASPTAPAPTSIDSKIPDSLCPSEPKLIS